MIGYEPRTREILRHSGELLEHSSRQANYHIMIFRLVYVFCFGFALSLLLSTVSFNARYLNDLLVYCLFSLPGLAFWVFLCGPASCLKWAGICIAAPLCLFSSLFVFGFEWSNGAFVRCCCAIVNGGLTDKKLRTFSDRGKVIFEGSIDNKTLRLIEEEFSSFQYSLLLTEARGPYCYKVVDSITLPSGCMPSLTLKKDGHYELRVVNRGGVEVLRRDVREVLNGASGVR
ncbi:MAG: hypothetical protein HY986_24010 [Candidatus Melainabacteria bacterium]|nr:hypothetical protein [Candidatus Melainabacteria bacterium]